MSFLLASGLPVMGLFYLAYAYRRKKSFLETPLALQVRDARRYGERFATLTLERPDRAPLPAWSAGSHIVVEVDAPRGKYRRAYSLVGGDERSWEIAVEAQPHGKVSNHLMAHAEVGQPVYAQPPRGRFFQFDKPASGQVCLLGGGAGIAPLIPMAREALEQGCSVTLIHSVRDASELIKAEALRTLAAQTPRLRYLPVLTRRPDAAASPLRCGRIDAALLRELGLARYQGDAYLCGSTGFVEAQAALLRQLGCRGRIIEESFSGNSSHLPQRIQVDGQSFVQGHAPTLLAACEENGVLPFAECRTGHCLNCRATLQSGQVRCLRAPQNTPPLPPGQILTCACVPLTDVVLEIPSAKALP